MTIKSLTARMYITFCRRLLVDDDDKGIRFIDTKSLTLLFLHSLSSSLLLLQRLLLLELSHGAPFCKTSTVFKLCLLKTFIFPFCPIRLLNFKRFLNQFCFCHVTLLKFEFLLCCLNMWFFVRCKVRDILKRQFLLKLNSEIIKILAIFENLHFSILPKFSGKFADLRKNEFLCTYVVVGACWFPKSGMMLISFHHVLF